MHTQSLWPTATERAAYIDGESFSATEHWVRAANRIEDALKDLADTDLFVLLIYANAPYAELVGDIDYDLYQETEAACAKAAEVLAIFNYVGARLKIARQHATEGGAQ